MGCTAAAHLLLASLQRTSGAVLRFAAPQRNACGRPQPSPSHSLSCSICSALSWRSAAFTASRTRRLATSCSEGGPASEGTAMLCACTKGWTRVTQDACCCAWRACAAVEPNPLQQCRFQCCRLRAARPVSIQAASLTGEGREEVEQQSKGKPVVELAQHTECAGKRLQVRYTVVIGSASHVQPRAAPQQATQHAGRACFCGRFCR